MINKGLNCRWEVISLPLPLETSIPSTALRSTGSTRVEGGSIYATDPHHSLHLDCANPHDFFLAICKSAIFLRSWTVREIVFCQARDQDRRFFTKMGSKIPWHCPFKLFFRSCYLNPVLFICCLFHSAYLQLVAEVYTLHSVHTVPPLCVYFFSALCV